MLTKKQSPAEGGRLKIPLTRLRGRDALSINPVFTNKSVTMVNGNREGRTHSAHITKPVRHAET
jgi:hypothetical protein